MLSFARRWLCGCCWRAQRGRSAAGITYALVDSPLPTRGVCASVAPAASARAPSPPKLHSPRRPLPMCRFELPQIRLPAACSHVAGVMLVTCATARTVSVLSCLTGAILRVVGPFDHTPTAVAFAGTDEAESGCVHCAFVVGERDRVLLVPAWRRGESMPPDPTLAIVVGAPVLALHADVRRGVLLAGIAVHEPGAPSMVAFHWSPLQASDTRASVWGRAGSLCVAGRAVTGCVAVCTDPVHDATAWMVEHADRHGVRVGGFTFDGHPLQTLTTPVGGKARGLVWASQNTLVVFEPEAVSVFERARTRERLVLTASWSSCQFGFGEMMPAVGTVAAARLCASAPPSYRMHCFVGWIIDDTRPAVHPQLVAFRLTLPRP